MIDPEFKNKWVAALKSGKHKQTRGILRDKLSNGTYSYCCLGLACEIDDPTKWIGNFYNNKKLYLTNEFLDKINMTDKEMDYYAGMNDKGKTFEEIAADMEINL